ncbi:MAG: tRNA glutamyl-Q(34) synthetase GluQRS [Eggerthellaceae bacterium]
MPSLSQQQTSQIVTRLAPTPSGYLHKGNIFSFLVCWLFARQSQGRVLLRIEDLDVPRCKLEFIDATIRDLQNLGLTWDNEKIMYQSQRSDAYEEALEALRNLSVADLIYPCFCSRADLLAASAPHAGERQVYAGTCRGLSADEREHLMQERPYALRCGVPDETVAIRDLWQGCYEQNLATECGDFIVRRKDGLFAYQLAVTVDDLAQGVNTVIRGVDLLSSAPQQLYLRGLLGGGDEPLRFGHVPLFVMPDGRRLAKRSGDKGVSTLVQEYGSVQAFLGDLAYSTGLICENEPITADELIAEADLSVLRGRDEILCR